MVYVRMWQQSDLPVLERMAALTAWNITPPDDQRMTAFPIVARSAVHNLYSVLGSPGGVAFVADDGGRPVAYLLIGIQPNDKTGEPQGYLADIYVEPQYRRMGISKELHRWGEEYLRRLGIRKVTNWTHATNALGQGASNHHGLRLTAVVMTKELRPTRAAHLPVAL